jgi:hypothetical protein
MEASMRIIVPLVAALLVLSSSAYGMRVDTPPKRYDRPHPNLIILEARLSQVDRMCRNIFGPRKFERFGRVLACASVSNGRSPCLLILPRIGRGVSKGERYALLRHERAHCNGWAGHHPHY